MLDPAWPPVLQHGSEAEPEAGQRWLTGSASAPRTGVPFFFWGGSGAGFAVQWQHWRALSIALYPGASKVKAGYVALILAQLAGVVTFVAGIVFTVVGTAAALQ